MPDVGKIATEGYGAGAVKYVTLGGFVPNPPPNANLITMGYGVQSRRKLILDGFAAQAAGSGGFYIFDGAVFS